MQSFCITLKPLSAFATSVKGDTLFGQLCWAIRNRLGAVRLDQLLANYTSDQPFAVISDAFQAGYLPVPKLPSCFYKIPEDEDRKSVKKLNWLPITEVEKPLSQWLRHAVNTKFIASETLRVIEGMQTLSRINVPTLSEKQPQPHNTINRQTNTTGEGGFAPYNIEQEWFIPGLQWNLYLLLDTEKLSVTDCRQCLTDIGNFGYGKDASIGLGKFAVEDFQEQDLPAQNNPTACLTLAPCAPQRLKFDEQHSYYQLFTRFGRHGDLAVHQAGKPFKNPVLLAETGALFTIKPPRSGFIGQGIGGNGELSKTLPATVHQGYAPVIGINFTSKECP